MCYTCYFRLKKWTTRYRNTDFDGTLCYLLIYKASDVMFLLDRMSMMDADSITPESGDGTDFENGLHQVPISAEVDGTSNGSMEIEGLSENLEDATKLNEHKTFVSGKGIAEEPALPPENHSTSKSKVGDSNTLCSCKT